MNAKTNEIFVEPKELSNNDIVQTGENQSSKKDLKLTKKKRKRSKKNEEKQIKSKVEKKRDQRLLNQKNKILDKIKSTEFSFNEIDKLFQKSRELYEEKADLFDLDKIGKFSKKIDRDQKWTADLMKSGTFQDKISAISLYIRKEPKFTLKYLDILVKICKKKNRRQFETSFLAVKDIFVSCYLTNKKTLSFSQNINNYIKENNIKLDSLLTIKPNDFLIDFYIEDYINRKYKEFIEAINSLLISDPLAAIRKKMMRIVLELIISKPEREDVLLEMLVNKLGDPEVDISNFTIKLLKELQTEHQKMSLIILKFVEKFLSQKNLTDQAQFYSIVFLSQMELVNNRDFIEAALKLFFDLFNNYSEKEEEKFIKYTTLIIKSLNILCKFSKENNYNLKAFFEDKLNLLFKLSHAKSLKLRYQVLKLIFYMTRYYDSNQLDRYFKSLYDLLLSKEITYSKYIKEIFLLLLESLNFDTNITRVTAFIKRLLQCCLNAEPSFIACSLMVVSQTIRNKNKIWKTIDKPELKENEYDPLKREPHFSQADAVPIYELTLLTEHYHPTIKTFAEFILKNYNISVIDYNSDPIVDFSLINFLDKFMLKNPDSKTKRELKKRKKTGGNETEEDQNKSNNLNNHKNTEFMKLFQKKEEKNKPLKPKKVIEDLDKIADEIMEKEYAKLEHFDIDDLRSDDEN